MLIVECFGHEHDADRRRVFRCHSDHWDALLLEGLKFGWKARGTLPMRDSEALAGPLPHYFDGGYKCEDILWGKQVTPDDAIAWAESLQRAQRWHEERRHLFADAQLPAIAGPPKPMVIVETMNRDDFEMINESLSKKRVDEFIAFLAGGGFNFFWDD